MAYLPKAEKDEVRFQNLWIARRLLAAFSFAQPEVFPTYISRDIVNHSPHPKSSVKEEDEVRVQKQAFPDLHFREELAVAEGDMVYLGWEATGTHRGPLYEKAPTLSRFNLHGAEMLRLKDGKVIEHLDHFAKPRLESLLLLGCLDDKVLQQLEADGLL